MQYHAWTLTGVTFEWSFILWKLCLGLESQPCSYVSYWNLWSFYGFCSRNQEKTTVFTERGAVCKLRGQIETPQTTPKDLFPFPGLSQITFMIFETHSPHQTLKINTSWSMSHEGSGALKESGPKLFESGSWSGTSLENSRSLMAIYHNAASWTRCLVATCVEVSAGPSDLLICESFYWHCRLKFLLSYNTRIQGVCFVSIFFVLFLL